MANPYELIANKDRYIESEEFRDRLPEIVRRLEAEDIQGVYFQVS